MPTDTAARALPRTARTDLANTRILRLALGTALALWFSQIVGWNLSYIAPIFTLLLLATPKPAPTLKAGVVIVALIMAAVYGGLLLLPLLIHQTAVGILILTLALFHTFYFTARSDKAVIGTLMVVGLTLTVSVGSVSVDAVLAVADYVFIGALVGVVFVWIAHAIIPDPAVPGQASPPPQPEKPSAMAARRSAMRSLAIVLPVAIVLLFSSDSASYMAVMIKVTSMTQQASSGKTRDVAVSLLLSTIIGGVAALAGWMLLGIWPMLTLYVLFISLAGLTMGRRIFAGEGMHGQAATWSYAYLTLIVILAPAVMDSLTGSAAGLAFLTRLLMFAGATLYGVVAVYIFDAFWPDDQRSV
ncbi:MAG: DUF2955 domain-containing protein [Woeseiaceae bacterium]